MSYRTAALASLALCAGSAVAASPLDRLPGVDDLIFESGNVAALSVVGVNPSVSGQLSLPPGFSTGDIAPSFLSGRAGVKYDLGSGRHVSFSFGTAWGVDSRFPEGTGFPLAGLELSAEAKRASLMFRQTFAQHWEALVGLNLERLDGSARIAVGPSAYAAQFDSRPAAGFVAGLAWARPETATYVRLTYESAIRHDATVTEQLPGLPAMTSDLPVEYPQAVTLQGQTGIAKDTVLIASVRWSDWSSFSLSPSGAASLTGPLLSGDQDTVSVTLGLGRKLTETLSGAVLFSHMDEGDNASFLMPSAGRKSVTLALRHETERRILGLGVQYTWLADADTTVPTLLGPAPASFSGNSALAVMAELRLRF